MKSTSLSPLSLMLFNYGKQTEKVKEKEDMKKKFNHMSNIKPTLSKMLDSVLKMIIIFLALIGYMYIEIN